jgi:Na+/melibiose symporter-like transporter
MHDTNIIQLFTGLYYVPFYFMSVKGHSATRSGVDLVPALVFILPGSIVVSLLTTRLGKFRWAIWIGWVVTTIGAGLLILLDVNASKIVGVIPLCIFGIGCGMVLSSVNFGIQAISKVEDCAMSASMYGFFRSLGMPIGVAVSL